MKLEPLIETPYMVTGHWRRFAVHVFEGKVTVDDMAQIEARSEVWHAKIPGKLVEMVIIIPTQAKMTAEERTAMARIIRRWEHNRLASATVILAQGIVGSMHRSVLTGMQMLAPAPHPVKVFGAITDAVKWVTPQVSEVCASNVKPDEIDSAIADLITRFSARPIKAPRD
jgi:hypothetical protein